MAVGILVFALLQPAFAVESDLGTSKPSQTLNRWIKVNGEEAIEKVYQEVEEWIKGGK